MLTYFQEKLRNVLQFKKEILYSVLLYGFTSVLTRFSKFFYFSVLHRTSGLGLLTLFRCYIVLLLDSEMRFEDLNPNIAGLETERTGSVGSGTFAAPERQSRTSAPPTGLRVRFSPPPTVPIRSALYGKIRSHSLDIPFWNQNASKFRYVRIFDITFSHKH